jgi:UPF0288 family protein (methanogenesis marker protein 3)
MPNFEERNGHRVQTEIDVHLGKEAFASLKHITSILDIKDLKLNHAIESIISLCRIDLLSKSEDELDSIHDFIRRGDNAPRNRK